MFLNTIPIRRNYAGRMLFCLLLPVVLRASPAAAETRFVYPNLDLPVRRGAGEVYKIIKMVRDGDQVEQIEEKGGWARIRFTDGSEGWIEQRLLTPEAPSAQQIEALRTENGQLKQKIGELEHHLGEANMGLSALKEQQGSENDKTASCNAQLDTLRAERRAEEDTDTAKRFAVGLGVFLIGWLLGRISAGTKKRTTRRLLS